MPPGAGGEEPAEHHRGGHRRHQGPARPAPVVSLDDAEGQRAECRCEEQGADHVGQPPAPRCAALHQLAAGGDHGRDAERDVDEERPAPAAKLDQGTADRRAEARGHRCRGAPEPDRVRPPVVREGCHDQGQRGRDQHRRAERLQDPRGDKHVDAGRRPTEHGRAGEDDHSCGEGPSSPQQVGQASADDEERREDDVVGVQHPRQLADRGAAEGLPDARKGDVDDGRVQEGKEGSERRNQEHPALGHAPCPGPAHEPPRPPAAALPRAHSVRGA